MISSRLVEFLISLGGELEGEDDNCSLVRRRRPTPRVFLPDASTGRGRSGNPDIRPRRSRRRNPIYRSRRDTSLALAIASRTVFGPRRCHAPVRIMPLGGFLFVILLCLERSDICRNKMSKFRNTRYHSRLKLRSVNIQWHQAIDNGRPQRQGCRNAGRIPMTDGTEYIVEIPAESRDYRAEFAFSIYDNDGTNVIDAVDLGNVLRALNLNPTNITIEKLGGTKKKGEKKMKIDEFLPIFSQCKKDKDQGCYEDFLECLKLYDKQENGTMLGAELSHTLLSLGERLTDQECDEVLKDCMEPEDDDGFIPYAPFLKKMMVLL